MRVRIAAAAAMCAWGIAVGAAAPILGIRGARFTVDGQPKFLIFVSYFDGVRRARALQTDFDYLKDKVDGIRVFPNWWAYGCPPRSASDTLFDINGNIRDAVWRDVEVLLNEAAARGLIVDLSFSRESVGDDGSPPKTLSPEAFTAALTKLVGSSTYLKGKHPHVLVDVQNEWPLHMEKAAVDELLRAARKADPARMLAASSSGNEYAPIVDLPNLVAAYHDPRGGNWFGPDAARRSVARTRAAVGARSQPVYLQEPMPASAVCAGQIHDPAPTHFGAAVASAESAGAAAWTFHTRLSFDLKTESLSSKLMKPENRAERQALEGLRRHAR